MKINKTEKAIARLVRRRQRAAGFPCGLELVQLMVMKTSSGQLLVLKVSLRNFFREIEKIFIRRATEEPRNYE